MYKKVDAGLNFIDREKEILTYWKKHDIFRRSTEKNEGGPEFTFYDGPPTANGKPHIGHILTRVIKDIIPRYRTMKGYHVLRKAGWDTHGLPVELEVEKQLGISGKPQIEEFGIEPFLQRCKESVWKYKGEWEKMSDRVGYWVDMEHPYVTYENDYIESEWWALKTIAEKGLLYKGHKVVPYCPRCGTALSSHEVAQGYKEITLLGQNVNSYGKDLGTDYDFADLLAAINAIPGDYWLRFMSSQPKDATNKLFDTMARCEHVAKQLHLPVQSGCDRVLKAMNRPYTRAKYEEMIACARSVMPSMVLTSDVIIGFPGETEDEAMQTVDLVEKTQFDALFTFIFSPRPGTPAAKMDDPVSREEKQVWFEKLVDAQNAISAKKHAAYIGRTVKVLVDGESDDEAFPLTARTEGNRLVRMKGDKALIGTFAKAKITDSNTWALYGEAVEE